MRAHVLLNLLNKLEEKRGLPSILLLFRNEFNKFNNTGARMLDSIYDRTCTFDVKTSRFCVNAMKQTCMIIILAYFT